MQSSGFVCQDGTLLCPPFMKTTYYLASLAALGFAHEAAGGNIWTFLTLVGIFMLCWADKFLERPQVEIDGVKYRAVAVDEIPLTAWYFPVNDGRMTAIFTKQGGKLLGVLPVSPEALQDMYAQEEFTVETE